ncbi:hypothetical protein [Deinococcus pimensis]|uniref:hypothetical protein n=1 Tax=Deinococcus pimensis TaxID=309888 RepID=UPI0004819A9A|nr:hypothetical protein [Deinococcus pimensis]
MKRALAALVLASLSCALAASPLSVSGTVTGDVPAGARVGAWLVNVSGAPVTELGSVAVQDGRFSLSVADAAPPARSVSALSAMDLTWPGVTGDATVTPNVRTAEARLFVYGDANGNGRRDESEALLEAGVQSGRASVVLVYVDRDANVKGDRGLNVDLAGGWNSVSIELGKALKTSVARGASGVRLVVTR